MPKLTTGLNYYARMPSDRLVCGLMHVIVRNSSGRDDAVEEYHRHWSGAAPAAGKASSPFEGTQPINTVDPDRESAGHEIGDYDCFLIYVISGCHLQIEDYASAAKDDAYFASNPGFPDTTRGVWYDAGDITHNKCQSFVRYRILSRGNNAYGHDDTFWHNSIENYTHTSAHGLFSTSKTTVNLLSDTKFDEPSEVYASSDYDFGSNLGNDSNNTYMSPVSGIHVTAGHKFEKVTQIDNDPEGSSSITLERLVSHEYDFYNLVLQILLFSYNDGANDVAYFKNRVNVFFQPFGETSNIEFSLTEYTT